MKETAMEAATGTVIGVLIGLFAQPLQSYIAHLLNIQTERDKERLLKLSEAYDVISQKDNIFVNRVLHAKQLIEKLKLGDIANANIHFDVINSINLDAAYSVLDFHLNAPNKLIKNLREFQIAILDNNININKIYIDELNEKRFTLEIFPPLMDLEDQLFKLRHFTFRAILDWIRQEKINIDNRKIFPANLIDYFKLKFSTIKNKITSSKWWSGYVLNLVKKLKNKK
jgi:hypothetical protein